MTFFPDDPAEMFVPANKETPPRYTVGVLRQWDPVTFSNVVEWRGTMMQNLAVVNRVEALSFVEGQNVALLGMSGTGALVSFAILGGYLIPGTDAATQAVAFLQSELARQISAEIFADRIVAADTAGPHSTSSNTYVALSGPEVELEISPVGRAVVFISGSMNSEHDNVAANAFSDMGGRMGFAVTGATTQAANVSRSAAFRNNLLVDTSMHSVEATYRWGTMSLVEGLNAGVHQFEMMYASLISGRLVTFSDRTIIVIGF